MMNINIISPEQLPNKSGLIGHVNKHGEVGAVHSARNGANRYPHNDSEKNYKASVNGDENAKVFDKQGEDKVAFFIKFPEATKRLIFWEMDFDLADYMARKFRKTGCLYIAGTEDESDVIKARILNFLKQMRGSIGGTPLGLSLGMELTDSHRGWKYYNPLMELVNEGKVLKKRDGKEAIYRIAPAHRPLLKDAIKEQDKVESEA